FMVRRVLAVGVCTLAIASVAATTSTARHTPATLRAAQLVVNTGPGHDAQPDQGPIWQRVHSMTLLNKVRQLMVLSFAGTGVPLHTIDALRPGGLIYFANNL